MIVTGLPRTGTSTMMGSLDAGGVPCNISTPNWRNGGNPKGYFEMGNAEWWADSRCSKVLFELLLYDPHDVKGIGIVMTRRDADRRASSQGVPWWVDQQFTPLYAQVKATMRRVEWTVINFYDLVDDPVTVANQLIAAGWPITDIDGFAAFPDPLLVNHRS